MRIEREIELQDPDALAIKGLGHFSEFQAAARLRALLENWHLSDFHIQDARPSADAGFAGHLSARGDNVAQVAQLLYEHDRDRFNRILEVMPARVPGVDYARRGGQVFVSTHSPEFLNGVKLDEIYWLVKKDGFATARRASDSELLRNLYAEGDLWHEQRIDRLRAVFGR